jgi:glycosyltransferase involved in cell wall biosynthesis
LISVYKLYNFFRKEKPLIVHTHTPKAGIAGMIAAYLAKVPIRLHTVAGLPLMEASGLKRKLLNFVEKLTYGCATSVYPNSKGLYDFIISEKFTIPHKVKIIAKGSSNGIDTSYFNPANYSEAFKSEKRKELEIPLDNFVFVFVGRIVADKGINELIHAFTRLFERYKNSSLILVGPLETELDPLAPETLALISSNSNIHSLGYQQDVRPYLAISDALTFPSYREGFPNVVMQAGAMGLPSIVTNINGCNEIISEGENGLIIPVKDRNALFEAMSQMIRNIELFENMKNNARTEITFKYERKEMFKAILQEYRDLVAKL